jgi:Fe2+ transport system protein B
MNRQSKFMSFVEALTNMVIAFAISCAAQYYIVPIITGKQFTLVQSAWIVVMFTVLSLVRQYLLRRLFNRL